MGLKSTDSIMPVVPMFHANAWGLAERAGSRFENRQSRPEYGWREHLPAFDR